MPKQDGNNTYQEVYGLVYALDVKTPVYKIYRGYINSENGNLYAIDPS